MLDCNNTVLGFTEKKQQPSVVSFTKMCPLYSHSQNTCFSLHIQGLLKCQAKLKPYNL